MMDGAEREFLVSVFLMEAWDGVAAIEEQIDALRRGDDGEALHVVAHKLRGAAALHGFTEVSEISARIDEVVENRSRDAHAGADASTEVRELVAKLKHALEIAALDRGQALVPESDDASAREPTDDALLPELERFFSANADVLQYFLPEAGEHLDAMTAALAAIDQDDRPEVTDLFRAVHTLKGAAYTVGCRPIGDLAHRVEDLLAMVRDGRAQFGQPVAESVLTAVDVLRLMLGVANGARPDLPGHVARARELLARAVPQSFAPPPADTDTQPVPTLREPAVSRETETAVIHGRQFLPIPSSHPTRTPGVRPGGVQTVRIGLDRLDILMNLVGELVSARTRLERRLADLDQVADLLRFTGGRMGAVVGEFERKYIDPRLSAPGVPIELSRPAVTSRPAAPHEELFDELEFDRYDDFSILARSVGELSTDVREIQARLSGAVRGLRSETAQLQRLGGDLRTQVGRARMVPISRLFGRLPRQIREIGRTVNRPIALTVEGETVEVDSSVIEQLADPLLHLLQNAVVHGIEPEEDRIRAGKPRQGVIVLRAAQVAGTLRLDVIDDGRGIDVPAVKERARARGLVPATTIDRMERTEAIDLIFLPGLSTAPRTTTVAGRGVGMDVVRASVTRMGGSIAVETRDGEGTRFAITLPLAVAITDALLVRVGRDVLAVPGSSVKAVLLVRRETIQRIDGNDHITLDQETLRLRSLSEALGHGAGQRSDPLVVLALRVGRQTLPLVVDELLRKEEVVVKGLGRFLEHLTPYSGATISAEGRVVMILDAVRLLERLNAAAADTRPGPDNRPVTASAGEERRVLLVDDSVSVRRFVGQMLERAGLEVVTANDGAEALERLRHLHVDAVVTDLEMPKLNGFELIRDLRRRATTRGLPIVVLTTRAGDKHADLARQLGATHYVTKPVEEQGFVRLVEALTGGLLADTRGHTP